MLRKLFVGVVALGLGTAAIAATPTSGEPTAAPARAVSVGKLHQVNKLTYPPPSSLGKTIIKILIRVKTPEKSSQLGDMQGKLQQPVKKAPR
jgi:hypothetical protein